MPSTTAYSILLKKENAHDDPIFCCAWTKLNISGDSNQTSKNILVTGGLDSLVKVWTLENNKLQLLYTLKGHTMAVVSVAVSPDGYTLASASIDSSLIIWELSSGQKVHEVHTEAIDVWKVTFSPDGMHIATGGHTGKVMVYDVEKGNVVKMMDTRGKFASSVAWSPCNKYLSTGAVDGTICIFDVAQGKLLHSVEAHTQMVRCVAFSPNSKYIATACNDGSVKLYDVASASFQHKLDLKCWAVAVCFSPDGTRIATASADGRVRVVLIQNFTVLHTFQEHTDMCLIVLSLAVCAYAVPLVPVGKLAYAEAEAPAHYEFQYSVHDTHTGDVKEQQEARAGDAVHGSYSLVQPDGVRRIVEYTSDKEHGFNAQVRYEGTPVAQPTKIAYAAPVAKLAYAAPVAKVTYAHAPAQVYAHAPAQVYAHAPVTKVLSPAPVAKLAYAAPLAHVTFSSPAISYHH